MLIGIALLLYLINLALLMANAQIFLDAIQLLKEWQVVLAALIAVGAASIAYIAAMAKVHLDRDLAHHEVARRRLRLYLKLGLAIDNLVKIAMAKEKLARGRLWTSTDRVVKRADLEISGPPELEEAWNSLDDLPEASAFQLNILRTSLRSWINVLESYPADATWLPTFMAIAGNPTYSIGQLAKTVQEVGGDLVAGLSAAITTLTSESPMWLPLATELATSMGVKPNEANNLKGGAKTG